MNQTATIRYYWLSKQSGKIIIVVAGIAFCEVELITGGRKITQLQAYDLETQLWLTKLI